MYAQDIFESQNYEDMFKSVFEIAQYLPSEQQINHVVNNVNEDIKWAKKILKKNDRIVWYLRVVKYRWLKQLNNLSQTDVQKVLPIINKEMNKLNKFPYIEKSLNQVQNPPFIRKIEHFLSLPVDKIKNYVWSNQTSAELISQFEEFEQEWQDSLGENGVEIKDGDKLLISFDGGSKAWWLLDRGACGDEADKMGHCGNVPSEKPGDRILQFRTATEKEEFWVPHLTFILHDNGYLGEMKGRSNDKPAKKYHPYIVKLLMHPIIEGIKGGGYEPGNNFSLNDLPDDVRNKLTDKKPELMSLYDLYKKEGFTRNVEILMNERIRADNLPSIYGVKDEKVILKRWADLDDLLSEIYNNDIITSFQKLLDEDEVEVKLDLETVKFPTSYMIEIVDKLTDRTLAKLARRLNIQFDYSDYNDRVRLAEAIKDSNIFDEIVIPSIETILSQKAETFNQHPKINEFKAFMIKMILYNNRYDLAGIIDYQHNNFEDIEIYIPFNKFMEFLDDDSEENYLRDYVMFHDNWFDFDNYNFNDRIQDLYENDEEILDELKPILDADNSDIVDIELQDSDIEKLVGMIEKEFNLMDSIDYEHLKKLAGI